MLLTDPRSYQGEAVEQALSYDGFAFFSEQRTGKCLEAIAVLDERKPDCLIIVCPRQAVGTWENELEKHLEFDWECEVHIITYQTPVRDKKIRKEWYEWTQEFVNEGYTLMVIADEAHYIKKPGTSQSQFVRTLAKRAHWRIAITGTPVDKGYEQFWAIFDFIQHGVAFPSTYRDFKTRYVVFEEQETRSGRKFPTIVGYNHEEEMHEIIHTYGCRITFNAARRAIGRKPVHIKKKKIYFDLSTKSRKLYEELDKELEVAIGRLLITSPLPMTNVQKLQQICGGFLLHQIRTPGKRRRKRLVVPVGDEKLTALMQLLSGMGEDEKIVICARYKHEIDAIEKMLDEFNWTYKEISGRAAWDHDFNTDVVVLQERSGLGFDLSEANTYIFYSWGHSYITFEQARFRIMNMETTEWVRYYFLMARDTIEEDYYEAPLRKKDFSALVLDRYPEAAARRRERTEETPRRVRKARKKKKAA